MSKKIPEQEFALAVVQATNLDGSDDENIERALDIYWKAYERCVEINESNKKPARTSRHNPGYESISLMSCWSKVDCSSKSSLLLSLLTC
ncbi:hypothetical protein JCM19029_19130 [Salinicoccus sesuvii]